MPEREPDPVDLMLEGKFQDAAETYLELYVEALTEGDEYVGADLLTQLHHCFAGMRGEPSPQDPRMMQWPSPQDVAQDVREAIFLKFKARNLPIDEIKITDNMAVARESLRSAKKRAERSIDAVEKEKDRHWN